MNCKNCNNPVSSNFCERCGQKTNLGKITLASLSEELSESIFQLNRGFLYTLKCLIRQPGKSIKNYLEGKRKRFFKPISYLLILSTVYFLISKLVGQNTWMNDFIEGFVTGAAESKDDFEIPKLVSTLVDNYAYTTLLLIPVFSLASFISFYKANVNYLEHIVLNSYITGQQAIFYSFFAILNYFFQIDILETIPVLLALVYSGWVFHQFYENKSGFVKILSIILSYVLYVVFATLLFGLVLLLSGMG